MLIITARYKVRPAQLLDSGTGQDTVEFAKEAKTKGRPEASPLNFIVVT
jgi:hypothetical protein